ncbi:M61 family metallopeptidase [Fulvivirga sp. 29W222]|uniref:M61 family metallopeptidase n=2 Tax=Fulvivirga marina TaxID=2494733 RepID=A0A937KCH8_9BACT|nr:M61 family metallopeptidase [Fulvivirga marina]
MAQTHNVYEISFDNAVHHEATVKAHFTGLENKVLELRMSRTSPGRYALHEFAKNVYHVKATDSRGNNLQVTRPNPYQWDVSGHDGTVIVTYTLYGNRGDGTYTQVDETHAHLNIPATFMYAPRLALRPIKVTFNVREDLNWKVATQLKQLDKNTYYAPNLHYFMDSPTEISNYSIREFTEESNGKTYNIRFILHHKGSDADFDTYVDKVKNIVAQEKAVFGELPDYDFGTYTFLGCYLANVSGDGMEHRNSTILTDVEGLAEGGMENNIGTVSHEYFHAWNVERIRPLALEPFDYTSANMSGELWFAEGFTSYYTNLILCRAGVITREAYVEGLAGSLNYVWNSPALKYFNPIEMSYQAPFVDAARSVDPVNWTNTFVSYYSYGSVLGLALDLSLRNQKKNLTLDGYMQLMWKKFGKNEIPYTVKDLENTLTEYAGEDFASTFFTQYIYQSNMPDYKVLMNTAGVIFEKAKPSTPYLGAYVKSNDSKMKVVTNPHQQSPLYKAGVENGDYILSIGEHVLSDTTNISDILKEHEINSTVTVVYERGGERKETIMQMESDPAYKTTLIELQGKKLSKAQKETREDWLEAK